MVITKTNASAISKGIEISTDNELYTIEEGVLFNKNKTVLIAYSKSKKDSTYVIPDSVTTIDSDAFCGNNYLTTLYINQNLQAIGNGALYNTPKLINFVINEKNQNFIYKDFCFQTTSGDIIKYVGGSASIFNVSSNCRLIHKGAFCGQNQYLTTINIPYNSTLKNIGKYNFNNFVNQVKIECYAENEAVYNIVNNYFTENVTKTNSLIYKLKSISFLDEYKIESNIQYSFNHIPSVSKQDNTITSPVVANYHTIPFNKPYSLDELKEQIVGKKLVKEYSYTENGQNKLKSRTISIQSDNTSSETSINNFNSLNYKLNSSEDSYDGVNIETQYYGEHSINGELSYNGIIVENFSLKQTLIDFPMSNTKNSNYENNFNGSGSWYPFIYWDIKFSNNNTKNIKTMLFTFSSDSATEGNADPIYISNPANLNGSTNLKSIVAETVSNSVYDIRKMTGNIAGANSEPINSFDNICRISMYSDSSVVKRGFAIIKVLITYEDNTTVTYDGSKFY